MLAKFSVFVSVSPGSYMYAGGRFKVKMLVPVNTERLVMLKTRRNTASLFKLPCNKTLPSHLSL